MTTSVATNDAHKFKNRLYNIFFKGYSLDTGVFLHMSPYLKVL